MSLRTRLVGTRVGDFAIDIRARASMLGALATTPAEFCDRYNNHLAGQMIVALRTPGRVFVDVGAHLGSVATAASRRCEGAVVAIEAIPAKVANLRTRFPDLVVHECAALDRDGTDTFFIDSESGYSSLAEDATRVRTPITVTLRRLDDLLDGLDVDAIKIDVEGAELGVMRGAAATIMRTRPIIMFESCINNPCGYTLEAMWDWCDAHDLAIFAPDRVSRNARAATRDVFVDSHEYPRRTTNYFAIPEERRADIAARARAMGF